MAVVNYLGTVSRLSYPDMPFKNMILGRWVMRTLTIICHGIISNHWRLWKIFRLKFCFVIYDDRCFFITFYLFLDRHIIFISFGDYGGSSVHVKHRHSYVETSGTKIPPF